MKTEQAKIGMRVELTNGKHGVITHLPENTDYLYVKIDGNVFEQLAGTDDVTEEDKK